MSPAESFLEVFLDEPEWRHGFSGKDGIIDDIPGAEDVSKLSSDPSVTVPGACDQGLEGTQYRNDRDYRTRRYRCQDFADCPVRWQCSRQQQGRTVKVSAHAAAIERQRQKQKDPAKAALLKRRMGIVEPVFARIKHLLGFRRWTVGGLEKVRQQWYWVCALANLMKLYPLWREGKFRPA